MNWNNPVNPEDSLLPVIWGSEPDAVDYLAAIADPDGDAAKRIAGWKKSQELLKNLSKASDEIYKATQRNESNWIRASPQVAHTILGGTQITCG
jgi:hypothetical protein